MSETVQKGLRGGDAWAKADDSTAGQSDNALSQNIVRSMTKISQAGQPISEQLMKSGQPDWVIAQNRAFMGFCNSFLWERRLLINDFSKDLTDGLILWNLLELLSGKEITGIMKTPKFQVHKMENLNKCMTFITRREGLKVVNIGSEDIHNGNLKIILGLIWTLILRYQIQKGGAGKDELLKWCQSVLNPQGIEVKNFTNSWKDGRAFAGLVNHLKPGSFDNPSDLSPDDAKDTMTDAFDVAQKDFDIPGL